MNDLWEAGANLLWPRRCPFCDRVLGFAPECEACAPALERERLAAKRLDAATHYFGALSGAAAPFRYQGCVRNAILHIKYSGTRWYGRDLGNILAKELFGCTFISKYGILHPERAYAAAMAYDVIVPVPPSDRTRSYNVPFLLAEPLAEALERPLLPGALRRTRFTCHQAGLPLVDRLANVAGAFGVQRPFAEALEGRRVLLVDDVITTGATAAACTQALLAAGAESVFAIGLASSQWQTPVNGDGI